MLDKDTWLHGIRTRAQELTKLHEKYSKLVVKYETFQTAYELFGDCLEYPHKTKLDHVVKFIQDHKEELGEPVLEELRQLYNTLEKDFEIILGNELGAKKVI